MFGMLALFYNRVLFSARFGVCASNPFPNVGPNVAGHSPVSTATVKNAFRPDVSYKPL